MLRTVVVTAGVVMLGLGAVNVLLVPFIVDELAVPETWFGLLEAAQVTSMVLAGALIAGIAAGGSVRGDCWSSGWPGWRSWSPP